MTDKERLFFDLFIHWLNHNGYSYENAAERLKCDTKHISWMRTKKMMPKDNIVKRWLPTLLEGYNGNILKIYETFK